MTSPKGNSEYCFPEANLRGTLRSRETKLTVSRGASHQGFCYTSHLKIEKQLRRNHLLEASLLTNLPQFQ